MVKRPDITTIASGYYSRQALNNNFESLRDAFDNTLSLDGSTPNAMGADFDVNGYRILNAGQIDTDALYLNGVAVTSASDVEFQTTYLTASYTGNGSTVAYSLTANPQSEGNVSIYVDGVYQNKDTFSLSGTTVTFSEAPPLNAAIEIVYPTNTDTLNGSLSSAITYNQGGTGAQDRNVQQKLQETVSVKDFGAVGDGVTDDTAAIQAAIDAVNAAGGGRVIFPTSSYVFGSVSLYSNVQIEGNWSTVLPLSNPAQCFLISSTGAFRSWADISISGFYIDDDVTNFIKITGNSWTKLEIFDIENLSGSGNSIVKTEPTSGQNPTSLTLKNLYSKVSGGFKYIWHSDGSDTSASIDTVEMSNCYIWPTAAGWVAYVEHQISSNSCFDKLFHGAGSGVGGGVLYVRRMVRGAIGKLWSEASNGDISMLGGSFRDLSVERLVMQTNTATETDVSYFINGHAFNVDFGICAMLDDNAAGYERDNTPPTDYECFTFTVDDAAHISRDVRISNIKNNFNSTHLNVGSGTNIAFDTQKYGVFTPEVADASTGGNTASGTFRGIYAVVGNICQMSISLTNIDTTGLTSGNPIYIGGLPFVSAEQSGTVYSVGPVLYDTITKTNPEDDLVAAMEDGDDFIRLYEVKDGAADGTLKVSQLTSGTSDLSFTIMFII